MSNNNRFSGCGMVTEGHRAFMMLSSSWSRLSFMVVMSVPRKCLNSWWMPSLSCSRFVDTHGSFDIDGAGNSDNNNTIYLFKVAQKTIPLHSGALGGGHTD